MNPSNQRARHWGIPFEGTPGKLNAITDVAGVEVGQVTVVHGSGRLQKGIGPVRTGVTAILPAGKQYRPVFSNFSTLNGNGDMTGTHWISESGFLETPVLITNTGSVGIVRDAALGWMDVHKYYDVSQGIFWYSYPVVAETWDGILNDTYGFHVTSPHVWEALDSAAGGPVAEGAVGGGTGMVCHGFKGGTGTASRVVDAAHGGYTVGILVQANHGMRQQLTIAGVPVGKELAGAPPILINDEVTARKYSDQTNEETGSIIVVLATDAPLLPHQLKRLTNRVSLGIGKVGGIGGNGSGDIFVGFSTANQTAFSRSSETAVSLYPNDWMNALFTATIEATEEAILNALVAAKTMKGINDNTVPGLPVEEVVKMLKARGRIH